MFKKITAITLIIMLLVTTYHIETSKAAAPLLAIPAVKYAVAAAITGGGLYALNKDSLDYVVNDYWDKTTDFVKQQWIYGANAAALTGRFLLDGSLANSVTNYLSTNYQMGINKITGETKIITTTTPVTEIPVGQNIQKIVSDSLIFTPYIMELANNQIRIGINVLDTSTGITTFNYNDNTKPFKTDASAYYYTGVIGLAITYFGSGYNEYRVIAWYEVVTRSTGISQIGSIITTFPTRCVISGLKTVSEVSNDEYNLTGSLLGFGYPPTDGSSALDVPCPPVPPEQWRPGWEEDLTNELVGEGAEVIKGPQEWFVEKDTGKLYHFPPGDPPPDKNPDDDEPIMIPPILPPKVDPIHPPPGQPGPATPDYPEVPPTEPAPPCPYCPPTPWSPSTPNAPPCPNPYCPNQPAPITPPVPVTPGQPTEPCPYCPPTPWSPTTPNAPPCPNPYCPNQPAPMTPPVPSTPQQPNVPDDRYIDFEPLKRLPHIFTNKFPFSLPWDVLRGLESLEGNGWDRKIAISLTAPYWNELSMEIDLSMWDNIARLTRLVFLIIFDFGLIFSTRKLMGGDV